MDAVSDIKARISIDQLVGKYVQLQKKGRNFVGLCPFHQDTKPSFLVSPDKGICYCFPCQKGGDIFNFYQLIEGVDFKAALKDLAEMAGVTLPDVPDDIVKKDEKERMRECLQAASAFYVHALDDDSEVQSYLQSRGVTDAEKETFQLGKAPDSFSATYEHLLKVGFSRKEIQGSGLGIQKELNDERMYDRFRNRLMFPIHDAQGRIVGFGGRTLGDDDAKYLNTSDGPLYRKSQVLFGLHHALKPMRDAKRAVIVEGYFDVLACHRVGVPETVATCGTAFTEDHARLLKRYVDAVVLCLDSDPAGKAAADRAFVVCSKEGLRVEGVHLGEKDPADAALQNMDALKHALTKDMQPYIAMVCDEVRSSDLSVPSIRQSALDRLLSLIHALQSATERSHAVRQAAAALGTTETTFLQDVEHFAASKQSPAAKQSDQTSVSPSSEMLSPQLYGSTELCLGLFLLYPRTVALLQELIPPEDEFASALFEALKAVTDTPNYSLEDLSLTEEERARARVLVLYCEENGFSEWNESTATREIRKNCRIANKEHLLKKQRDITKQLLAARKNGDSEREKDLANQYQQLLALSVMAR